MSENKPLNSMCAIYVELIRAELDSPDSDGDKIEEFLTFIEENCHVAPFKKGETPQHLEKYLIEEGEKVEGTVYYKGKPIPGSAAEIAKKRKKDK